ncbi:hypothetical protein NEPAR06_1900 [Nematocida parisii]|uniref:Uncharacterized protein n=1 Tax=Nematocida parisii (strain ERTm3) TaxID=935791 RepID=I3EE86_NEMP3|nr:hypothetical protein NEQG_02080 [Nematocida parisii ERTm3]KAI5145923.1 hypothetical protein NEPAR07_1959 [Nematocida parisii]KAI5155518.1 hypothetical protein NEPAR06_1900 [Nematocida parisii]KAI5158680.1 hypothetical protein NEPAR05_2207 [Nematocida parisii]
MEEKYILFKRKQFRLSTIPTGRNIIALLLLIQAVYTQVELLETNRIHDMVLRNNDNVAINPNGEVSPLKLHLMHNCGYIQNLRKYLPWIIDAESSHTKANPPKRSIYSLYLLNGTHADSNKTKYLKEFNRQLVNMFPSEEGRLSIVSESYDSFTRFLQEYTDTQDVLYVLASLFLLSQNVKIPIEIVNDPDKGNSLVLKKKESKTPEFRVKLYMTILDKNGAPIYQQKTEDIVNFFKHVGYGSSLKVPKEFSRYYNIKDLSEGSFLCNPRFLIQSYIFEYIDDNYRYIEFVLAIYELLDEKMPMNKYYLSPLSDKTAVNAYFSMFMEGTDRSSIKVPEYIQAIANVEKACNDLYSQTPAVHKEVLSMHYPIPSSYIRRKDKNIVTEDNYIEHLLFDLFVCFTFNQYTNKPTTSHLPSPSSHLVEFFDKNQCKIQSEDSTLRGDWCKMVSGNLSAENVFYTEEKNKIEFGLLNMLYAIKGLAGTNKELEVAINCVDSIIKRKGIEESDQAEIKERLENVFKSLSLNKSIRVECEKLKLIKTFSDRVDIFTDENTFIVVSYREYSFHSYRMLEIEMPHFIFDFAVAPTTPSALSTVDFGAITTQLRNTPVPKAQQDVCIKWHIQQYLDIQTNRIAHVMEKEYTFTNKIALLLNSGYNAISVSLLLWENLDYMEYRAKIVELFLIHSSAGTLDITNPMVQFTSKLIDSAPLDDLRVRKIMLRGCLYNKNFGLYYPQIKYDVEKVLEPYKDSASAVSLIENLFSLGIPSLAIANSFASLAALLNSYKSNKEKYSIFGSEQVFRKIIKKLSESTEDSAAIKTVLNTIRSCTDATGDYCADNIFMGWLFCIGSLNENIPVLVFKALYDYIEYINLTENVKVLLRSGYIDFTAKRTVCLLLDNKSEIMKGAEDLSFKTGKYHKILRFTRSFCLTECP